MKKDTARKNHVYKRFYLRHVVPVVVWLMVVACVVWLFHQRAQRFEIVGIARGEVRQIAISSTGRIKNLPVNLFEPVSAGQTLAVVDTICDNEQMREVELRAQLTTAAAEAQRLASLLIPTHEQLLADAANRRLNREDNYRRFIVDVESARVRILQLRSQIESDRITLDDLAVQVENGKDLLEADLTVPYAVQRLEAQHESVRRKIEENERFLEQVKIDLQQAEQRRDEFARQELPSPSPDEALEAIRQEIKVQEETMKGLTEQLATLRACRAVELRSPIDGFVIPIHARENDALHQRPGEQVIRRAEEVVRAGDPILVVAQREPTEIVAYVTEQQLGLLKEKMSVELIKTRTPPQIARSAIRSIGPTVELMPQRLWRNPTVPQWGRPVLIDIPSGLSIVPGEIVGIRGL